MSGGLDVLALKEEDVVKFLACSTHLGANQCDFQMEQYCYKRKADGQYIINLKQLWEKLLLAARAIAAIENPADVCVISSRPYAQRAILKFATATGATAIAGRYTPGTFTNQIQKAFKEPRLLVITDPRADHQPITEASYVNIPVVAFCNTDSPVKFIDIAIPCNTKSIYSVGLMWWILAREVLRLRGTISREVPWTVMPDLYFYRDPEEAEKEEQEKAKEVAPAAPQAEDWNQTDQYTPVVEDWAAEAPGTLPPPAAAAAVALPVAAAEVVPAAPMVVDEWGAQTTQDWAGEVPKAAAAPASEWGGGVTETWG
jgi:small subunit ribosomal protein SAe